LRQGNKISTSETVKDFYTLPRQTREVCYRVIEAEYISIDSWIWQ
jgi:hypothetical protein